MSEQADAAARYVAIGIPVLPVHTPILGAPCDCTTEELTASPKCHPPGRTDGTHIGCSCARRRGGVCRIDQPGKHPRTPNGVDDASTDAAQVAAWWKKWPQANIGGRADIYDLLDVDQPGRMPAVVKVAMPAKVPTIVTARGRHYLFAKADPLLAPPPNLTFGEYKIKGYGLLPPSLHPSGVRYRWAVDLGGVTPPVMTKRLADALHKARRSADSSHDDRDPEELLAVALAALEGLGIAYTEDGEGGYRARCPVHADDGQAHAGDSLSLRVGHSALLAYCFAGCDFAAIARKLGVTLQHDAQTAHRAWLAAQPPVDLAELLEAIIEAIRRFWIADPAAYTAVALWVVHTYVYDLGDCTPRLWVRSPTKRAGKTRMYEVIGPLLPHSPDIEVAPTAASLFRRAGEKVPFLLDEVDQWLGKGTEAGDAVIAVLNAGYKTGAVVQRTERVGDTFVVVDYPVFTPVAFSGIGELPDTIADRSIPITMRRRLVGEQPIERFRARRYAAEIGDTLQRLVIWQYQQHGAFAQIIDDDTLKEIGVPNDRVEEIWVSLLALAELAGENWPARAREAARTLHTGTEFAGDDPEHVLMLGHVRDVFVEKGWPDVISSADMRQALLAEPEWPWASGSNGRAVTVEKISRLLRRFGVRTARVAGGRSGHTVRSWVAAEFADAWSRYLPSLHERDNDNPRDNPPPDQDFLVRGMIDATIGIVTLNGEGGPHTHTSANGDSPLGDLPATDDVL